MPKKYIHKSRGKTMNYSHDSLVAACGEVKSGALSVRKAAQKYGIPRSTIADRVSGRFDVSQPSCPGRKPALPKELEDKIVSTVKIASQRGMGITRKQLLKRTSILCKRMKVPTPMFKKGIPGNAWWEGLKRRHPTLTIRKPEKLCSNRARALNPTITNSYFKSLGEIISDLNLGEKPHCIWNADETGIQFEHQPARVIAEKGVKSVVGKTSMNRTNNTIMACGNAAGAAMPPMVIVKGKTSVSLHGYNAEAAPSHTMWSFQEKGWMTDEIGESWFKNIFLPHCGEDRPQLLIMDGHSSHESLGILSLAHSENVHILCLPPHCTHFLQPLDRTVFGPFKAAYSRICSEYLSENSLNTVNKWSFPGLFKEAFETSFSESNLKNGFKACGIYPFNEHCLPSSAFQPPVPSETPMSPTEVPFEQIPAQDLPATEFDAPIMGTNQPAHGPLDPLILNEDNVTIPEDLIQYVQNPETFLELINTGELGVVETSTEDLNSQHSTVVSVVPDAPGADWNCQIEDIFLPASAASATPSMPKTTKKQTKHRLLTSEEIILEKTIAYQNKIKKEEEKYKRKMKKEATEKL